MEIATFPLSFAMNLKLLQKTKSVNIYVHIFKTLLSKQNC